MYFIFHNEDGRKVTVLKDDREFIMFMRNILKENGDTDFSILGISDALEYFEDFCPNLSFLIEKPKETPIFVDPHILYLNSDDSDDLEFNSLIERDTNLRKHPNTKDYSIPAFVYAFNNQEISDLGYIAIKQN